MILKDIYKPLVYVFSSVLALSLFSWFMYSKGQENIQEKWDKEKTEQAVRIALVQDKYDQLFESHKLFSSQVADTLKKKDEKYEKDISTIAADHADSLRKYKSRADTYQRQAEAGTAEARSLASHAAQLDASLIEGKRVAAELAATVRLRDDQLILLGSQIKADRAILEDGQ